MHTRCYNDINLSLAAACVTVFRLPRRSDCALVLPLLSGLRPALFGLHVPLCDDLRRCRLSAGGAGGYRR